MSTLTPKDPALTKDFEEMTIRELLVSLNVTLLNYDYHGTIKVDLPREFLSVLDSIDMRLMRLEKVFE